MPTSTSEGEILTLRQVAEFLKVTDRTIYRLAAAKKIPAFKVGGTWRFSKAEITEWIQQQSKGRKADKALPQEGLLPQQIESSEQMEPPLSRHRTTWDGVSNIRMPSMAAPAPLLLPLPKRNSGTIANFARGLAGW